MKITFAIALALLTIGVNATIDPSYVEGNEVIEPAFEEIEPFGATRESWVLFVNRIRKEIKGLIEEFEQCDSYESDALKGTCFTHWSLRVVSDIKQFVEAIKNWSAFDEFFASRAGGSNVILLAKLRKEVLGLIDEFEQCNSYESDALKGTCFTHWSIRFASDIQKFVDYFANNNSDELPETRAVGGSVVLLNKIKKEAQYLIQEYQQCVSYKSDIKKGKCLVGWSKVFAIDAINMAKLVLTVATPCKQRGDALGITKDVICTTLLVTNDVQDLIALFDECGNKLTDASKGLCYTRFSLAIVYDTFELILTIFRIVKSYSVQSALVGDEYGIFLQKYEN